MPNANSKGKLPPRGGLGQTHPETVAAPGTDQWHHGLHQRKTQRQNHRQMTQLRNKIADVIDQPSFAGVCAD